MAYGDNRNQVASDDFNSGINTSNWGNGEGQWNNFAAVSNQIETTNPGSQSAGLRRIASGESYDIGGAYDQYSIVEIGNLGSGSDFYGTCVRMADAAAGDESCYACYVEDFTPEYAIYEVSSAFQFNRIAGTSAAGITLAVGDKITAEAEGASPTVIRCGCDNPTSDQERVSNTDSTSPFTTGTVGCTALRGSANIRLDNWVGGTIGVLAGAAFPPGLPRLRRLMGALLQL